MGQYLNTLEPEERVYLLGNTKIDFIREDDFPYAEVLQQNYGGNNITLLGIRLENIGKDYSFSDTDKFDYDSNTFNLDFTKTTFCQYINAVGENWFSPQYSGQLAPPYVYRKGFLGSVFPEYVRNKLTGTPKITLPSYEQLNVTLKPSHPDYVFSFSPSTNIYNSEIVKITQQESARKYFLQNILTAKNKRTNDAYMGVGYVTPNGIIINNRDFREKWARYRLTDENATVILLFRIQNSDKLYVDRYQNFTPTLFEKPPLEYPDVEFPLFIFKGVDTTVKVKNSQVYGDKADYYLSVDGTSGTRYSNPTITFKLASGYNSKEVKISVKVVANNNISRWVSRRITVRDSNPPTAPTVSSPQTVLETKNFIVSFTGATTPENVPLSYEIERNINNTNWEIYKTVSTTSITETALREWNTVQYRVRAKDTYGQYSSYSNIVTITVEKNKAPIISGNDTDLGIKEESFTYEYNVTDTENQNVRVQEFIDGTLIREIPNIALSQQQTINLNKYFDKLNIGQHKIIIKAFDEFNEFSTREITFTKRLKQFIVYSNPPLKSSYLIESCTIEVDYQKPTESTIKIEVSNNPFDTNPTWEDCTQSVLLKEKYLIKNKLSSKKGFSIRVTMNRNNGTGECFVKQIGGRFQ